MQPTDKSLAILVAAKNATLTLYNSLKHKGSLAWAMKKSKLRVAVIINNLDREQTPTRRGVEIMRNVLILVFWFY